MYPEAYDLQCYLEDLPELQYNPAPDRRISRFAIFPDDTDEQVAA